jgi:DNA-binding transcriptional MerR regulator
MRREAHEAGALPLHIQVVSRLTNLTVDTIRAWEKRYAAVKPKRGPAHQRLFSADDVARLALLKEAVDGGVPISRVASLDMMQLRAFVETGRRVGDLDDATISRLLARVRAFDAPHLSADLTNAALSHSAVEFGDDIVAPLMMEIGSEARSIEESTARELLLCECIRSASSTLFEKYQRNRSAPAFLSFTLPGERHAIPPLLAALACSQAGYRGVFLGTEIGPHSIEALARYIRPAALGVYVGVQSDDAIRLLHDVNRRLPQLPLLVGSRAPFTAPDLRATATLRDFVAALSLLPAAAEC